VSTPKQTAGAITAAQGLVKLLRAPVPVTAANVEAHVVARVTLTRAVCGALREHAPHARIMWLGEVAGALERHVAHAGRGGDGRVLVESGALGSLEELARRLREEIKRLAS
jgi:hypothetical protein